MITTRHVLYRELQGRTFFWNTCGWSRHLSTARRYTTDDAEMAMLKMNRDGLNVTPLSLKVGSKGRLVI